MPSATMKRDPRGPSEWVRSEGVRSASPVVKLQIAQLSSLFLRTRPTSDMQNTLTLMARISTLVDSPTAVSLRLTGNYYAAGSPRRKTSQISEAATNADFKVKTLVRFQPKFLDNLLSHLAGLV